MLLLDVQEQDFRLRGSLKFQSGSWSLKFDEKDLACVEATLDDLVLEIEE